MELKISSRHPWRSVSPPDSSTRRQPEGFVAAKEGCDFADGRGESFSVWPLFAAGRGERVS